MKKNIYKAVILGIVVKAILSALGYSYNGTPPTPVEIKAISINSPVPPVPPAINMLNAGPYNWTPTTGSGEGLLYSVWPECQITLYLSFPNGGIPHAQDIVWTATGFNAIPNGATSYTFNWTIPGTKTVVIRVGQENHTVKINVPDVGPLSEHAALNALSIFKRNLIRAYGLRANGFTSPGGQWAAYPDAKKDAMRHAFWNSLCVSDEWINTPIMDILNVTTGHEWGNKWGRDRDDAAISTSPACESTMDLHNNIVGILTVHSAGGPLDAIIRAALETKYYNGEMWIPSGTSYQNTEWTLLTSAGTSIYLEGGQMILKHRNLLFAIVFVIATSFFVYLSARLAWLRGTIVAEGKSLGNSNYSRIVVREIPQSGSFFVLPPWYGGDNQLYRFEYYSEISKQIYSCQTIVGSGFRPATIEISWTNTGEAVAYFNQVKVAMSDSKGNWTIF